MVTRLIADLAPSISAPRLHRYRPTSASPDPDLEMLVNYLWNTAVAESLYCSLCGVEIALRNTLHDTLTHRFGTPSWYDQRRVLDRDQHEQVRAAKSKLIGRRQAVTAGRVVGELTFGFWVTILSRNYDARLWRGSRAASLKRAFPRVARHRRQRHSIHQRFNEIRQLRNRVFHHEPLFDDPRLVRRHQDIHWAIHWINPEMKNTIALFDRFPDVYQSERGGIEAALKAHLGIQ